MPSRAILGLLFGTLASAGRVAEALVLVEAVKVPDAALRMNEFPNQLSRGMRQQVVIAMACEPRPMNRRRRWV
nr:hypothetical protein [Oceaniglobus trochenteri]